MPLTIVHTLSAAAFIRRIGRWVLQSVRGGDGRATRRLRLHGLITLHTTSLVCLSDLLLTNPSSVFHPLLPNIISLAVSSPFTAIAPSPLLICLVSVTSICVLFNIYNLTHHLLYPPLQCHLKVAWYPHYFLSDC